MSNTAEYHMHNSNQRNNDSVLILRQKYDFVGYAIYNMMLEVLDKSDNFMREWSENSLIRLSVDFRIEVELLKEILEYCATPLVGLFCIENGFIYSDEHIKNHMQFIKKKEYQKEYYLKNKGGKKDSRSTTDIDIYLSERQEVFDNLDDKFKELLKDKANIERPYIWANRRIPVGYFDLVDCIVKVKDNAEWRAKVQQTLGIQKNKFLDKLFEFTQHIINTTEYMGYDGYDTSDGQNNFIKHFVNWLKKKL